MDILCPECRSSDGHYKVIFEPGIVIQGNQCPRCKGIGKVPTPELVWLFTHQDKQSWYSWLLSAPTQQELQQKLVEDCGRIIPMKLHGGLVAVQIEKSKVPADHRPYSEIKP